MSDSGEPRFPCKICGRQFVKQSLSVHERVCTKSTSKKRKVFDSAKQRADGSDVTYRQIKQAQKKEIAPPKSNWRAKHEDFINSVRAARGATKAMQEGGPLPPPPPPSINPDYIQCPFCSRRFNRTAADRHINFCKEQSQRLGARQPPNPASKAKQATRTQYQPPKPKVKNSPGAVASPGSPSNVGVGSRIPAAGGSRIPAPGSAGRTAGGGTPVGRGRSSGSGQEEDEQQVQNVPPGRGLLTGRDLTNYQQAKKEALQMQLGSKVSSSAIPKSGRDVSSQHQSRGSKGQTSALGTPLGRFGVKAGMSSPSLLPTSHSHQLVETSTDFSPGSKSRSQQESAADKTLSRRHQRAAGNNWQHSHLEGQTSNGEPFVMRSPNKLYPDGARRSSSSSNNNKVVSTTGAKKLTSITFNEPTSLPKFCHECGSRYPISSAKFCCECGVRRMEST